MRSEPVSPPALPHWPWRPLEPGELDHESIWLAVTSVSGLLGLFWLKAGLLLPVCTFKALTGCPCLTCGATRAALSLLRGDLPGAFAWNPLVVTAGAAAVLFNGYAILALLGVSPRRRLAPLSLGLRRTLLAVTLLALAANWAWVIWRGN